MDRDELDSVVERDDGIFLESGEKYVPLMQVFENYEVRNLDARDTAELLGVEEREVRQGVHYLHSNSEVYSSMEENIQDFSRSDHGPGAAERAHSEEPYVETSQKDESGNPLHQAKKGFREIFDRPGLSEEDLEEFPDEKVLTDSASEMHIYWEQNGSDLGVYAGFKEENSMDSGLISYSVDGKLGPVLEAEASEMEDMVQEMYRNAVFGSL